MNSNFELTQLKIRLSEIFSEKFGVPEICKFAPGRANIIGEHTDYNQGFVLPFAIEQGILFSASKNKDRKIHIVSMDRNQEVTFESGKEMKATYGWDAFFIQVFELLIPENAFGFNIVFGGNLSIGAGISSSSAITCGLISVLNDLFNLNLNPSQMVQKAVEAEVGYGVEGGMMDQFTIINGLKNHAVLLDCRNLKTEFVPLDLTDSHFYLFNTNVKHNLIDTDYNSRRKECDEAVKMISDKFKKIDALRDLSISDLVPLKEILNERLYARVSFVVAENDRVLQAVVAIKAKDLKTLGKLLHQSHKGLSELYEVSCDELDWLVEYVDNNIAFYGARMMGGGFGGCTINLVNNVLDEDFLDKIKSDYKNQFGFEPSITLISSQNGILNFLLP